MKQNSSKVFNILKAAALTLSILLAVGLLVHSVTFFCLNQFLDPFSALSAQEAALRLSGRDVSETVCSVVSLLYAVGLIFFALLICRKNCPVSGRKLCLFFVSQLALMAVCTVPFALLQPSFYGDYLTPILSYFNPLLLVCILYLVVSKVCHPERSEGA